MSNHPDFTSHGYQVSRELGRNREAGRITYLATDFNQERQVVIKEFRFAISGADWSGFKAYQREIEILQQLNHPRIPRYLDSFETSSGFCLVQEYKNAPSLAERRSFTPEEIRQIAVSVLEILVYLQKRTPAVIHRDIKPENILVDKQLNAYLIDFGFARIRGGEMALSSVAAGTVGFMPPEEQFGRSLTEASDLYSLGATLICLLTGTRSVDVGKLIDDNYRFDFKKLVSKINPRFVEWLTKMVEPNLKNRYGNALVSLSALKPIDVVGNVIWLETIDSAIKHRVRVSMVGLATLSAFVFIGTNSTIFRNEKADEIPSNLQVTLGDKVEKSASDQQVATSAVDFYRQGYELWNQGRFTEALAAYDKSIQLNPNYADAYAGRGASLSSLDRYSEALAAIDRAIQLNPDNTYSWSIRGYALENLGRHGEALKSYETAIQLRSDNRNAIEGRNRVLESLKQ
jgi:serine/threonine protein kinase